MQLLYCATLAFSKQYVGQLYRFCIPKRNKQLDSRQTKSKYFGRC
jgi:hypothetical protein